MNYFDAFGVPGVVTRMFNNYGPRQNPRYVTGTIITQALTRDTIELGALEPLRDFCFCADGVRGHLTVAAHGTPGDVYVYGQGENISMRDWVDLILRVGEAEGFWPAAGRSSRRASRHRPGAARSWPCASGTRSSRPRRAGSRACRGRKASCETIRWYAENRDRWIGRVDWLPTGARPSRLAGLRARRSVLCVERAEHHEVALLRRRLAGPRGARPPICSSTGCTSATPTDVVGAVRRARRRSPSHRERP